jgi:chromosome segregation ATPase
VLMGTLRWQKELAEQSERAAAASKLAQLQREAESAAAETRARLAALQNELSEREATIKTLRQEQEAAEASFASKQKRLRQLRTADAVAPRPARERRNGDVEISR